MYTIMWLALLVGGSWVGYNAYCASKARSDAKMQAAVDEYVAEQDDQLRQRASSNKNRTYTFNDNPRRIDDAQWRDWN